MKGAFVFFLIAALSLGIFHFSISEGMNENFHATLALPKETPREPMPENFTTDEYFDATNPYSNDEFPSATTSFSEREASNPIYVLIAGDEEERAILRFVGMVMFPWLGYATMQIERGDEALVANFGIDIRILGFIEWDSNDNLKSMYELWYDLESKTCQYLRTDYQGYWTDYVDAIIGITAQDTPDDFRPIAGLTPGTPYLNEGRTITLLKWQVYWADDNLVQHEVSHLFYEDDHSPPQTPDPCCIMASHPHFQTWICEDGYFWSVFNDIPCAYTSYSWCNEVECYNVMNNHHSHYENGDLSAVYLLYWHNPYITHPMTMCYWFDENKETVTIEVKSGPASATTR
ncbi:hypothetical protein KEJ15_00370 [Candidatus Bathyarchaeota archaeon]|nr:hypothetical protein [Candidatus Bathyarchaeota archaeon]